MVGEAEAEQEVGMSIKKIQQCTGLLKPKYTNSKRCTVTSNHGANIATEEEPLTHSDQTGKSSREWYFKHPNDFFFMCNNHEEAKHNLVIGMFDDKTGETHVRARGTNWAV